MQRCLKAEMWACGEIKSKNVQKCSIKTLLYIRARIFWGHSVFRFNIFCELLCTCNTIRYDTIAEINVDSKAEYTA